MLASRLQAATADLHQCAEAANFSSRIMAGTLTVAQYRSLLQRNFWFNASIEHRSQQLNLALEVPTLELNARKKSHLLERDLRQLDAWPVKKPEVPFPTFTRDEILGALYVSEGSTLGGQVIRKALRRNSAFAAIPESAFFTGYGEETGARWRSFISELNLLAANNPSLEPAAIVGARRAFRYFIALSEVSPFDYA